MKTMLYPSQHEKNPYISLINKAITAQGYKIVDMKDVLSNPKVADEICVGTLNWFDAVPNCSLPKALFICIRQMYRVNYFHRHGIKLIHTFHNALAHDTKHPHLSRFLMRYMCKNADRIAVLCSYSNKVLEEYLSQQEIEEKVRLVYHPLYENVYSTEECEIPEISVDEDRMHILFTGNIRPYKNIELILELAKKCKDLNVQFIIAGRPYDKAYAEEVKKWCQDLRNVTLIMRYVEDDEIYSLYTWADLVFLPLSKKSSLNSGSAMLAISQKKTIIGTSIGTLKDFPDNLMFTYDYNNESDQYSSAYGQLRRAYDEWSKDREILKNMGKDLYKYVHALCSISEVSERYGRIYKELMNESDA